MTTATKPKLTEGQVLDMLRARHVRDGNGGSGEYAFMTHVRNAAGFNSGRTFDAVVMNLWPSRGLFLHAYEVKCSRSDWLRELKQPEKAEAAFRLVDQFSVVAGPDIVRDGELPPTWGLLVVHGSQLRCVKEAPLLHARTEKYPPVDRQFVVAMLRAGGAVPKAEAAEISTARAEGRAEGAARVRESHDEAMKTIKQLRDRISDFERASGVGLAGWHRNRPPAEVGAALKAVLEGENRVEWAERALVDVRDRLRAAADDIERHIPASVVADGADS